VTKKKSGHTGACLSVIPALRKLRQEDGEFEASRVYIVRPYLNNAHKS
jgi:hypothetical protein